MSSPSLMQHSRPSSRRARLVLVAALLLSVSLLSGCIEWEEQEVRLAYDADKDRKRFTVTPKGIVVVEKGAVVEAI